MYTLTTPKRNQQQSPMICFSLTFEFVQFKLNCLINQFNLILFQPPDTGKSYRHAVEGAPKEAWQKKKSFLGETRTAEEKLMYELNANGSMSASVVTASPIGV